MISYFDTSALAKRYLNEAGSDRLHDLLGEVDYLETSVLTELEMISLLERSKSGHRIDSPGYRMAVRNLEHDISQGTISPVELDDAIRKTARRVIRERHLRVVDSIQLATALSTHKRFSGSPHFVCADQALLHAARLEGLKCLDPTEKV